MGTRWVAWMVERVPRMLWGQSTKQTSKAGQEG